MKFFRSIRQRLLSQNKFSKYLTYAIGEIVLVVIGILIALQINNANEARKDTKIEQTILESIHSNLIQDDSLINRSLARYDLTLKNIERIFNGAPIPDDSLAYIYSRATGHARFIPNTTAFSRSMNSGKFDLIGDHKMAEDIQYLYSFTYKSSDGSTHSMNRMTDLLQDLTLEYQAMDIGSISRKDLYDKSYVLPFNLANLKKRNADQRLVGLLKLLHINTLQTKVFYSNMLAENLALRAKINAYLAEL